jgi:putative oxidoreductase
MKAFLCKTFKGFNCFFIFLIPLADLAARLWIADIFFKSGLTKIANIDSTIMLFSYEYEVPLLSPTIAAYLGTAAELVLPVLLAFGLGSRLVPLGLFLFNLVAVVSYPYLFTAEGIHGLHQHIIWGILLFLITCHGMGKLSLDFLLCKLVCRHNKQAAS